MRLALVKQTQNFKIFTVMGVLFTLRVDSFITGLNTFTELRLMFINCFMRFNKKRKDSKKLYFLVSGGRKMKIKLIEARIKQRNYSTSSCTTQSVELIKQEETMTQKVLNFCANLLFSEHPMQHVRVTVEKETLRSFFLARNSTHKSSEKEKTSAAKNSVMNFSYI